MSQLVSLQPVTAHIRVFEDGGSYEERSQYTCIMTVSYLSENTVYIGGAHGSLSGDIVREIGALLKVEGVKVVTYRRNGKIEEYHL